MLSYGTSGNWAKVYTYHRTIFQIECENNGAAQAIALLTCRLLEAGDLTTALQVAQWNLDNLRDGAVNISLGPYYYLHMEDRTIRDMDSEIIWTMKGKQNE